MTIAATYKIVVVMNSLQRMSQRPRVWFSAFPKISFDEIYRWLWLKETLDYLKHLAGYYYKERISKLSLYNEGNLSRLAPPTH